MSGVEVPDDATPEQLEALFWEILNDMPAAAAGPGSYSHCQAELKGPDTISLVCEMFGPSSNDSDIKTASIPMGDDLGATLNRIAIQVGGGRDKLDIGVPDATLCTWDINPDLPVEGYKYFSECMPWDEKLQSLADAGAGNFDSGRVAHQAPNEMVVGQAYFLEIAIQPLTQTISVAAADSMLTSTLGTGLAPGSTETPFAIEFDTVKASKIMSATLEGDDEFQIRAMTPQEQAVLPDAPTVWRWRVVPTEDGDSSLRYNLSQSLEVDGERFERSVKTIWQDVEISTSMICWKTTRPPHRAIPHPGQYIRRPCVRRRCGNCRRVCRGGCNWIEGSDPDRFAMVLSNLAYSPPISRLAVTHEDGDRITER